MRMLLLVFVVGGIILPGLLSIICVGNAISLLLMIKKW